MRKAVKESEKQLDALKSKRNRIENKYAGNETLKSKKINNINKEVEDKEKVRKSLKKNVNAVQENLHNLNSANANTQKRLSSEKNTNDGNDSYSSSVSSN